MQDEISTKIRPYLGRRPTSECEVVYVLAEIYKFLERGQGKDDFPALIFFRNWALHAELSGKEAQELLARVNEVFQRIETATRSEPRSLREPGASIAVDLYPFVSFDKLKQSLRAFCARKLLPTIWADDGWTALANLYSAIIMNCPLKITGQQAVTEAVLTACREGDSENIIEAKWELHFGKKVKFLKYRLWPRGEEIAIEIGNPD